MAQETLNGPDSDHRPFNTADETPERGWSPRRIIASINTMLSELYASATSSAATSAALDERLPEGIVILNGAAVPDDTVQAVLSTALTGADNDLDYTAVLFGADGNDITVRYLDPSANDATLSVAVVGTAITFSLATDSGGAITSTADDLKTELLGSAEASALVTAADKSANDGSGVVTALAATHLADGADGSGQDTAGTGSLYSDTDAGDLYINAGDADALEWKLVTRAA